MRFSATLLHVRKEALARLVQEHLLAVLNSQSVVVALRAVMSRGYSSSTFARRTTRAPHRLFARTVPPPNARLQPRRRMIAPGAAGCEPVLGGRVFI
jgi:hypothetical protein